MYYFWNTEDMGYSYSSFKQSNTLIIYKAQKYQNDVHFNMRKLTENGD